MQTPPRLGPLIIDVKGLELTATEREMLIHPWVGGVIYFSRNFQSRKQIADLSSDIQALRKKAGLKPLLICVDHEGGRVQRFREGFTEIPSMASIGADWKEADEALQAKALASARHYGYTLAKELSEVGVGFSFAPVLDLDWGRSEIIGARAFHRDPHAVSELASALMHGLLLAGFKNCAKHFPGHGWAQADSHLELPVDERPLSEILSKDALAYGLIGSPAISAVMPAHIVYSQVDQHPAGFSAVWLKDILRKRLQFGGVIISDDLAMAGAAVHDDIVDRAQAAFGAGCDAALICNSPDLARRALDELPRCLPGFIEDPQRQGLERLLPWVPMAQ